jgi:hypothetical protein
MDFIDKALESRQLSQNSINLYKRNLLKLNDNKPVKSFHFLKNKEDVLDKIKGLNQLHNEVILYPYVLY